MYQSAKPHQPGKKKKERYKEIKISFYLKTSK